MVQKQKIKPTKSPVINIIFIGTAVITLFFNSGLQDPFNAPKMWILILVASALTGHILFYNFRGIQNRSLKSFLVIVLIFISFSLVSVFTSSDVQISMLGESQRRNGFVTYISLAVVMISAVLYVDFFNVNKLITIVGITSLLLIIYGFMQFYGRDFVSWNNPYNRVIGTAGNPNFSAAIFAFLCTFFTILSILKKDNRYSFRNLIYLLLAVTLFANILNTQARQGVLAYGAGIMVALTLLAFSARKFLGYTLLAVFTLFGILIVQGVLNSGPLSNYLYKETVGIRGYYWRTGIEMFQNNIFNGVGLDNYGGYFNYYRDVSFPLKYGFEVMSNNAHNTFIQMFATGGIFVGFSYLLLQILIIVTTLKALKLSQGNNRNMLILLFSTWVTFQTQSLVSIDNIAISIWGWTFGGLLVGLNIKVFNNIAGYQNSGDQKKEIHKILSSFSTFILATVLCSLLYRSELNMYNLRAAYSTPANQGNNQLLVDANELLKIPFVDAEYKNQVGFLLATSGFVTEGTNILKNNIAKHPVSINSYNLLSNIYESLNQPENAIPYRLKLMEMNPWNAKNHLQLGKNYKKIGDFENMDKMYSLIESFASSSEVFQAARNELVR